MSRHVGLALLSSLAFLLTGTEKASAQVVNNNTVVYPNGTAPWTSYYTVPDVTPYYSYGTVPGIYGGYGNYGYGYGYGRYGNSARYSSRAYYGRGYTGAGTGYRTGYRYGGLRRGGFRR